MYLHRLRINTDPALPRIRGNVPEYYQSSIVILSSRTRLYLCTFTAAVAQLFYLRALRYYVTYIMVHYIDGHVFHCFIIITVVVVNPR